jgi:hypothetical protein
MYWVSRSQSVRIGRTGHALSNTRIARGVNVHSRTDSEERRIICGHNEARTELEVGRLPVLAGVIVVVQRPITLKRLLRDSYDDIDTKTSSIALAMPRTCSPKHLAQYKSSTIAQYKSGTIKTCERPADGHAGTLLTFVVYQGSSDECT